jgi:hypothetical protein
MDTLYKKFDNWFNHNLINDNKVNYELERSESYNFIIWVDNTNDLTKSYWAKLKSFIKILEEKFDVNIIAYIKNFEL